MLNFRITYGMLPMNKVKGKSILNKK